MYRRCIAPINRGDFKQTFLRIRDVSRFECKAGLAFLHQFGNATDADADNRGQRGQGFQTGVRHVLPPLGTEHAETGVADFPLQILATLVPQQVNAGLGRQAGEGDQ